MLRDLIARLDPSKIIGLAECQPRWTDIHGLAIPPADNQMYAKSMRVENEKHLFKIGIKKLREDRLYMQLEYTQRPLWSTVFQDFQAGENGIDAQSEPVIDPSRHSARAEELFSEAFPDGRFTIDEPATGFSAIIKAIGSHPIFNRLAPEPTIQALNSTATHLNLPSAHQQTSGIDANNYSSSDLAAVFQAWSEHEFRLGVLIQGREHMIYPSPDEESHMGHHRCDKILWLYQHSNLAQDNAIPTFRYSAILPHTKLAHLPPSTPRAGPDEGNNDDSHNAEHSSGTSCQRPTQAARPAARGPNKHRQHRPNTTNSTPPNRKSARNSAHRTTDMFRQRISKRTQHDSKIVDGVANRRFMKRLSVVVSQWLHRNVGTQYKFE